MKVLVADDDPVYQDLLESLLLQWQFEPIVVSDGLGAWEIMQRHDAPPVVLLDWMMPIMDGFEVTRPDGRAQRSRERLGYRCN